MHVDAPVWEPLLDWFCFESDFADDFPAYGRMSNALDADERDRWKQYLNKFIETEDHAENIRNLQARAEAARKSVDAAWVESSRAPTDDSRGSEEVNEVHVCVSSPRNTLWARLLGCWRRTRQHPVLGRLTLAAGSTCLGYLEGRSFNYFSASSQVARQRQGSTFQLRPSRLVWLSCSVLTVQSLPNLDALLNCVPKLPYEASAHGMWILRMIFFQLPYWITFLLIS